VSAPEEKSILNLNGIASVEPPPDGSVHFQRRFDGGWMLSSGGDLEPIWDTCRRIDFAFQRRIMAGVDYANLAYTLPMFVVNAGLNSEAPISRDLFGELLRLPVQIPERNRFLYLYDCERLTWSVRQCIEEIQEILGAFYAIFNAASLTGGPPLKSDGVVFSRSPKVTQLFANLSFIFIRLHSLLDYCVKLAIEATRPQASFQNYKRMASRGCQFGDRKNVSWNGRQGTLFEDCELVRAVETLRNHIVHDGLLDALPKVYERYREGMLVERFILFPDMTGGRLDSFVNRNLFYGREDKLNLRLTTFVSEFWDRLAETLRMIEADISSNSDAVSPG
jgi:hypothetical protein